MLLLFVVVVAVVVALIAAAVDNLGWVLLTVTVVGRLDAVID